MFACFPEFRTSVSVEHPGIVLSALFIEYTRNSTGSNEPVLFLVYSIKRALNTMPGCSTETLVLNSGKQANISPSHLVVRTN